MQTIADWERDRFHRATADAISALPETPEPSTALVGPVEPSVRETLLERSYAGLQVEIVLLNRENEIALLVREGEKKPILQPIEGADAFDAFAHPYCYLPA